MTGIIFGSLASLIGLAAFKYGKSMNEFKPMMIGAVLMIVPIVADGWTTAGVLVVSLALLFAPI